MPYTVTCHDGNEFLESFDFDTEREATECAIVAKRTYDFCPAGTFENEVSVVIGRGPGRPKGSTKPEDEKRRDRHVTLSDDAWGHAEKQGNASRYIEGLILGDRDGH